MKNDWSKIMKNHVIEAIDFFETSGEDFPQAINTLLIYQGKEYSAKHIRWIVYQIALGFEVSKSNFGGGKETVDFFQKLGFETRYTPEAMMTNNNHQINADNNIEKIKNTIEPGITENKRQNLKIGLYLQGYDDRNNRNFKRKLNKASKHGLDIFVFPETCFTPYERDFDRINLMNESQKRRMIGRAKSISRDLGCAVIVGAIDKTGIIYNVYANAFAGDGETREQLYFKHTATENSPLGQPEYREMINEQFTPILLKENKIGMTICYDCTHPAISRAWGKRNVDIIINSTGGNVINTKWHRYNKVRSLENKCFSFCTMGYSRSSKVNSYTYGFTPNGARMTGTPIFPIKTNEDTINNIFIYDTAENNDGFENDITLDQAESENKNVHWKLKLDELDTIIRNAKQLSEGLYLKQVNDKNLVICRIDGEGIMFPEKVLRLMYHKELEEYSNKRYLILNEWNDYSNQYYNTVLSDVLKTRTVENFCAVLYRSPKKTMCFQSGNIKNVQALKLVDRGYGLDFKRMTGPESAWRNNDLMKAIWRKGYTDLINTL